MLKEKEVAANNAKRNDLIEKVTNNSEVNIPEAMILTELENMMQEFEQRLQMQGMNLEQYFQFSGQSEDDLKEQMRKDAEMRVKTNLVLEAILEAEELEVEQEDIDKALDEMAQMYQIDREQIVGMLGGNTSVLENDLRIQKAIEFLVEESKAV